MIFCQFFQNLESVRKLPLNSEYNEMRKFSKKYIRISAYICNLGKYIRPAYFGDFLSFFSEFGIGPEMDLYASLEDENGPVGNLRFPAFERFSAHQNARAEYILQD